MIANTKIKGMEEIQKSLREEMKSLKLQLTAAKKEAEEEQSKVDLITRQLTEERESEQHKVASLEADLYVTKNLNAALNGRLQDQKDDLRAAEKTIKQQASAIDFLDSWEAKSKKRLLEEEEDDKKLGMEREIKRLRLVIENLTRDSGDESEDCEGKET